MTGGQSSHTVVMDNDAGPAVMNNGELVDNDMKALSSVKPLDIIVNDEEPVAIDTAELGLNDNEVDTVSSYSLVSPIENDVRPVVIIADEEFGLVYSDFNTASLIESDVLLNVTM